VAGGRDPETLSWCHARLSILSSQRSSRPLSGPFLAVENDHRMPVRAVDREMKNTGGWRRADGVSFLPRAVDRSSCQSSIGLAIPRSCRRKTNILLCSGVGRLLYVRSVPTGECRM